MVILFRNKMILMSRALIEVFEADSEFSSVFHFIADITG